MAEIDGLKSQLGTGKVLFALSLVAGSLQPAATIGGEGIGASGQAKVANSKQVDLLEQSPFCATASERINSAPPAPTRELLDSNLPAARKPIASNPSKVFALSDVVPNGRDNFRNKLDFLCKTGKF